jgi:hypothetical protein
MASGLFERHSLHLIFAVFDLIYAFVCKQVKLILSQSLIGHFCLPVAFNEKNQTPIIILCRVFL